MNSHEIERIAASMNQLRPDWPEAQLTTLLRDERITHRPRRDVAVALAWVACEAGTANPYRVLEAGPWWKAAGTEGATTGVRREWPGDAHRCRICSLSESECHSRRTWSDHDFEPATLAGDKDLDLQRTIQGLRQAKAEDPPPQPERETSTEGTERVEPMRAKLAAAREEADA